MNNLILAEAARKLTSESSERKNKILEMMNKEIRKASSEGRIFAPFPSGISQDEKVFLAEELTLAGYRVSNLNQAAW